MNATKQAGPGQPKKDIDLELVYALAKIHCTEQEIANIVGCHVSTISRRCSDLIARARDEGRMSLRRAMYHKALNESNVVMQIFMAKNWLGMADSPVSATTAKILPWNDEVVDAQDDEPQEEYELTEAAQDAIKQDVDAVLTGDYSNASEKGAND